MVQYLHLDPQTLFSLGPGPPVRGKSQPQQAC